MRIVRTLATLVSAGALIISAPAATALAMPLVEPGSYASAVDTSDEDPVVEPTDEPTVSPTDEPTEEATDDTPLLGLALTAAPANLRAEAGNTATYLDFAPVAKATNYKIRVTVSSNPEGVPTPGTGTVSVNVANTSAIVTKLSNDVVYSFEVASVDTAGVTSEYSLPVYATPAPVANVMGTPSLVQLTRSGMSVRWSAGTVAAGVGAITGYRVTYDSLDGYDDIVHTTVAADLNDDVDGLVADSTYAVRVAAINDAGAGPGSVIPLTQVPTGPEAPTGFTITSRGNRVVNLGWDAVEGATSYKLNVAVSSNPDNIPAPALGTITYSGSTAKVSGLTNGVTYAFKVAAVVGNQGDWTAPLYAAPDAAPVPSNLILTGIGNQAVYLDWSDALKATAYRVSVTIVNDNGIANPSKGTTSVSTTNSSSTTTGLTNGVEYGFTIAALVDGNYTGESDQVNAIPLPVPNRMSAPTAASVSGTSVGLKWTAATISGTATPVTSYTVEYWPTASPDAFKRRTYDGATLTGTITGLSAGTEYSFTVAASNDAGSGPASTVFKVVAANKPGAVMNLTARRTTDGTAINLDWDPPTSAGGGSITKYSVSTTPAAGASSIDTVNTTATVTGLAPELDYKFTVYAYTSAGAGAGASVTSIALAPKITAEPQINLDGQMAVTFTPNENPNFSYEAQAYQVERLLTSGKKPVLKASTTTVTADTVTCASGLCTATWKQFGDNINGQAWSVRVRANDGIGGYSNWAMTTPAAPLDAQSLTQPYKQSGNWYIKYISDWAQRTDSGVWSMSVNSAPVPTGQTGSLGQTPGKQVVSFVGLGGTSTYAYVLPDKPVVPDSPQITTPAAMAANGNATVSFTADVDGATSYEAVAEQSLLGGKVGSVLSVAADTISCSAGTCTATWAGFSDAVNGRVWAFKVRAKSDSGGVSDWASSTPAGPQDAAANTEAYQSSGSWFVRYTGAWDERTGAGIWSMSVDGTPASGGVSGNLGAYPGTVHVTLAGIGGSSQTSLDLPQKPAIPDTPVISAPASINSFSTVRLNFAANTDRSDTYEARAWQALSSTYVPADSVTCSGAVCQAEWNNFSSYLNGSAWTFQVRAKGTTGLESAWAEQASAAPASASELVEAYRSNGNWYVEYTADWNSRFSLNVATMLVNNKAAANGVSDSLGAYPGRVTVKLIGLGGTSTQRFDLPDQPLPPAAPVITGGPAMDASGNVTVPFTGESTATFEARAVQNGTYVDASNVSCVQGSCTAQWSGFGSRVNGTGWSFEVRGVNAGLYSVWVSRSANAPAPAENLVDSYESGGQWYVKYIGDWNARTESGVWTMSVNGKPASNGVSAALGAYPGNVSVTINGLGGTSSTTVALPDTPPVPDAPAIVNAPDLDSSGTVRMTFNANSDSSVTYQAQATQAGGAPVAATSVTCAAGVCTATWTNFGPQVDGNVWNFSARAGKAGQWSAWTSASASAPSDAAGLASSYKSGADWFVKFTPAWSSRTSQGVWLMSVNGKDTASGVSENLGAYPGNVTVTLAGLGGQSSTVIELPQAPAWNAATGGYVSEFTDADGAKWRVHTFDTSTNGQKFTVTSGNLPFDYLLVGGSGSSGFTPDYGYSHMFTGGSSGGGGVLVTTGQSLQPGAFSVWAGLGAGSGNGGNSTFGGFTAYGGGAGGNGSGDTSPGAGSNGASGGGGGAGYGIGANGGSAMYGPQGMNGTSGGNQSPGNGGTWKGTFNCTWANPTSCANFDGTNRYYGSYGGYGSQAFAPNGYNAFGMNAGSPGVVKIRYRIG